MNNTLLRKGPQSYKIVVVGDSFVGKTCLIESYLTRQMPKHYEITVMERYFENITVDGQDYHMTIWDTVSGADYERLRSVLYDGADCIFICYAVNRRESFTNAASYWFPEVRKSCPMVPVIFIATKIDLRDEDLKCVSYREGKMLKKNLNAAKLVECSALWGIGLQKAFLKAIRTLPIQEKCKVS
ncbi:ras-like GTP-binding protein RhoL [Anabrus simplex]|uniref:ras-like GTP-binding protein RhoL n=1 Tax=Anabrus simplex TaxID=316456 RepID=UPI0035A3C704